MMSVYRKSCAAVDSNGRNRPEARLGIIDGGWGRQNSSVTISVREYEINGKKLMTIFLV
jgi:hypothetical protein